MNINFFIIFLLTGLMMIFIFFKPMKLKENKNIEIANIEAHAFIIHELDTEGLSRVIKGSKAFIYKDRYNILDVEYTDATKRQISNLKAKNGIYKNNIINLFGNVKYTRGDGLVLKSKSLSYNEKTSVLKTNDKYIMYKNESKVLGTSFELNNDLNKIISKNVQVIYQIEEN